MLFVILSEEMMGAVSGRTTTCTTTSSRQNWPSKATSRSAPSRPGRVAGIAARYKKTGLRLETCTRIPRTVLHANQAEEILGGRRGTFR